MREEKKEDLRGGVSAEEHDEENEHDQEEEPEEKEEKR